MTELLSGLRVRVVGNDRVLRVAAAWFADLGAHVELAAGPSPDLDERLWLDRPFAASRGDEVDVLLTEGEESPGARVIVRYCGSGSRAPVPGARFDGRGLAGAGGVAVAIGEPDKPPLPVPDGCLEYMVGAHVAGAALAALLDGVRHVEVAGVDVVAWSVATNANLYNPYGAEWRRAGRRANGSGGGYPYSVFDVADGQFVLICRTARDWDVLVTAMGNPEWTQDARYQDRMAMAREHPDEVDDRMAPWLRRQSRKDMVSLAARCGFPGGPVLRPDEVLATPALEGRWRVHDLDGGTVRSPGQAFDVAVQQGTRPLPGLSDLLVLDLSWVWSGPATCLGLADLGCTVVKIESETRPDNTRLRGSPVEADIPGDAPALELTPYFHAVNRGKQSVSLDLKSEEGRALLVELAARADVIVENLSPGVMERFGVAPHQVHRTNPDCVYLGMRGFRGHWSTEGLRAYAPVLSAGAGIEALVAYDEDSPIGMMTYGLSDANAASHGLALILAALYARRESGVGADIMLSQLDAAVSANGLNLVRAQTGRLHAAEPYRADEPVVTFEELPKAPWTSTDLFGAVTSPWLGELAVSRLPWRLDGALPALSGPGPVLGADTDVVLGSRLGLSPDRLAELRASGALA